MKNKTVYINREPVFGPWGGGTKFVNCLVDTLQESGHNITFDLSPDVDVIFCFDPRPNNKGLWYQDMLNHKIKYNSKIVARLPGDNCMPEPSEIDKIILFYKKFKKPFFASNLYNFFNNQYPGGIGAEVFGFNFLDDLLNMKLSKLNKLSKLIIAE